MKILALISFIWMSFAAAAQSLPVSGDTFVSPGTATNYSTSPTVNVGGTGNYQGLIAFDLSGLPAGTTSAAIAKATVTLFVNKLGAAGAIDVSAANGTWTEAGVNGINAPVAGTVIASQIPINAASVYVTVDATALVKAWVGGTAPNSGILISADAGYPATSVLFDSKESSTTSHPAVLQVVLSSTGAQGPQGPQGQQGPAGMPGATGPQGSSGVTGYQRVPFNFYFPRPVAYGTEYAMATLTFTPSTSGTALLIGRGSCNMSRIPNNDPDTIVIEAAATADEAGQIYYANTVGLQTEGAIVDDNEEAVAYIASNKGWTTETSMAVTANTSYTITLWGMHPYIGSAGYDVCGGTFSVSTF